MSSATASAPTRAAWDGRSRPSTYSQPAAAVLPWKEFGKLRRCTIPCPAALQSTIPPVSTKCCSLRDPSLLAK